MLDHRLRVRQYMCIELTSMDDPWWDTPHTRDTGYERSWPGPELYIAYLPATRHAITQVQAGIGQGCSDPISHLPTSAQPRVGSYISPARVRPPVYTRTRIMRARGRAHAPARGDKPLNRSRIRYVVEDRSRIQG